MGVTRLTNLKFSLLHDSGRYCRDIGIRASCLVHCLAAHVTWHMLRHQLRRQGWIALKGGMSKSAKAQVKTARGGRGKVWACDFSNCS